MKVSPSDNQNICNLLITNQLQNYAENAEFRGEVGLVEFFGSLSEVVVKIFRN